MASLFRNPYKVSGPTVAWRYSLPVTVHSGKAKPPKGLEREDMTEDQAWRIAATAAAIPLWAWLIQKTEAYLTARRNQTGRGLLERIAYRLGRLGATGYRRIKQAL